jgi:hypothetical protein
MSLIMKDTDPWGIYAGVPAKRIKEREKTLLQLEKKLLASQPQAECASPASW